MIIIPQNILSVDSGYDQSQGVHYHSMVMNTFRCQRDIRQGIRSMTRFCSKIGWKWKWSEKCRKSEISLIWCISTTNNVKSCKKFNETAQTANFTDFSLTSCEYRPKWTKTMQTQTRRVRLQNFLRGIRGCHMKADVLAIPKMWLFVIL